MASRHLKSNQDWPRVNYVIAVVCVVTAFVAIAAAVAVHVVDGNPTSNGHVAVALPTAQPVSQEGTLVAVSPTSVTAQSIDGFARTYVINSETNAITEAGSVAGGTGTFFAVNDEVQIVGIVQDGTAVATAVAGKQVSNLNGPPMDGV